LFYIIFSIEFFASMIQKFLLCRIPRLLPMRRYSTNDDSLPSNQFNHIDEQFKRIPKEDRNKATFNNAVAMFQHNRMRATGHVEFLNVAVKYLKEFNLHKDLDTYKNLLNVFPKGPLIPTNVFQKMFQHFPLQQHCCVNILDTMEWHGVHPDKEIHDIVANAFGEWNFATRKIKRMLYWMPKLRYTNKYLDRRDVENKKLDDTQLARIALKMMCRDPGTSLTYLKVNQENTEDGDSTVSWIVSAQSPLQRKLISQLRETPILYVDGPNLVYVMEKRVKYFILSGPPEEKDFNDFIEKRDIYDVTNIRKKFFELHDDFNELNVHQQADQTILGLAVFEHESEAMSLSWINHLSEKNPKLKEATVLFRIKKNELNVNDEDENENGEKKEKWKSAFKGY
jgi:signaling intermediate in Toll pathway protein